MVDTADRGAPSNLRGWLSDVYLPALLSGEVDSLARRLGDRATVDDPIFGRAQGENPLGARLRETATWLSGHQGSFERSGFVMGSDRDVTYGVLSLSRDGQPLKLPVAVVAERRPEREVAIRVYHAIGAFADKQAPRGPLLAPDEETAVPPPVAAYLEALARGDLTAVIASFEDGAILYDGRGNEYVKEEGAGSLHAYYTALIAPRGTLSPISMVKNARADDGRTCALEYTMVRFRGREVAFAGFAVFERGESGLLHALRSYDDVDSLARAAGAAG
jgi:hypothetical protein